MKTVDDYIVTSKPMSLFSYWAAYVALMILLVATYSLSRWLPPLNPCGRLFAYQCAQSPSGALVFYAPEIKL